MQNRQLELIVTFVVGFGLGALIFAQKPANAPTVSAPSDQKQEATTSAPAPALNGEVAIGALLPLSGSGAELGGALQKSMDLAVKEINATGGVGGKKLTVTVEDGACDNLGGQKAAKKLFTDDQLKFVVGGGCDVETLGAAPIANASKGLLISPSSNSASITAKGGAYVLRFAPSEAMQGKVAATYALTDMKAKRAAVIYEGSERGVAIANAFMTTYDSMGGGVVLKQSYPVGSTDFARIVTAVKNASNISMVYVVSDSGATGVALVRALGLSVPILSNDTWLNADVVKNNKDILEGVTWFTPSVPNSDHMRSFVDAYRKAYESELSYPIPQANAYSEVYLAKELIEKNLMNAEKMLGDLVSLKAWSGGALTDVTLDTTGDIQWKNWDVMKATSGDLTTVKSVEL